MKRLHLLWVVPCLGFLLAGCGIQTGRSLGYEADLKSIKAPIDYWETHGWTAESRMQDWMKCGGHSTGSVVPGPRLSGETNDFAAHDRSSKPVYSCMKTKGYVRSTGRKQPDAKP